MSQYYLAYDMNSQPYFGHSGVKGMKWGSFRWWTPDKKLTPAGREHYGIGDGKRTGPTNKSSGTHQSGSFATSENRFHSRQKRVEEGSVTAEKGERIKTGGRPVGQGYDRIRDLEKQINTLRPGQKKVVKEILDEYRKLADKGLSREEISRKLESRMAYYRSYYGIDAKSAAEIGDLLNSEDALTLMEDDEDREYGKLRNEYYALSLEAGRLSKDMLAIAEERDNAKNKYGIFSKEYKDLKDQYKAVDKQYDDITKKITEMKKQLQSLKK